MSDVTIFVAINSLGGSESTIKLEPGGHGTYLDDSVFASVDHQHEITEHGAVYVNASRVRHGVVEETMIGTELLNEGEKVEQVADGVTVRFHHLVEGESI